MTHLPDRDVLDHAEHEAAAGRADGAQPPMIIATVAIRMTSLPMLKSICRR
jgi:hypothetical protein